MPSLNPGDVFEVVENRTLLQKGINLIQGWMAKLNGRDGKSENPHTGIILHKIGITFESNMKIGYYNLFKQYAGKHVRIWRYEDMTLDRFIKGYEAIKVHDGWVYPFHRLVLFMIPGLAERIVILPKPVCSELEAKFLYYAELRDKPYWGTDVDELADERRHDSRVKLVFDDILPKTVDDFEGENT